MSSAKIRLPILVERSLAEATTARNRIAQDYEVLLRGQMGDTGLAITCSKGCNHCCHYPVLASIFEGITIYRWLSENHLWTTSLRSKLADFVEQIQGLSLEVWLLSAQPCPLLTKEGACSVYPVRPFSCRVTYSIGDPHYCHPHRLGDSTGILPKNGLFEALEREESELLRQHHLQHFRIPLAKAILLGERVAKGELDLEDTGMAEGL